MVLKLPQAQKRMFRIFENCVFCFFYKLLKKLKPVTGKVRKNVENCLNKNLVLEMFLENGLEATLRSKTNVLNLWNGIFQFFASFWVRKLKSFSREVSKSLQNHLNPKLVIGSILENGFEATLKFKTNVLSFWKWCFSYFCKFLSDDI